MLKKIGTTARKSIEEMSGRKIFLELHVKVRKNWRNDPVALRQLAIPSRMTNDSTGCSWILRFFNWWAAWFEKKD